MSVQAILQGQEKQISKVFYNLSVATDSWSDSTTYSSAGFTKQASVPCSGITSEYIPTVVFAPAVAIDGNLAPVAQSTTNAVIIYAKETPSTTVTIPTLRCDKVVQ